MNNKLIRGSEKMDETRIYYLANKLGVNTEEIDRLAIDSNNQREQPLLSMGPFIYPGTHYGTISIKDF